ncbi:Alpha/Beta hydrolase protein [Mycena galericulata]|nr:Alpha/Beta hydrolase protein [Mycena galericulata]
MAQLYTEHTLKLPDGVEILYTDSGAPGTSDYTTLVVLHGTAFNGYGFVRLHEYASKYNMRVILCNRRGYHGSTKFSEGEVAEMRAAPKAFQDRVALQLAWFLQHFVKEERIPKATLDNANRNLGGGIVLMGWSFGNATSLALLADPGVIPKDVYGVIEPYLRTLVVYGACFFSEFFGSTDGKLLCVDPPDAVLAYSDPKIDGVYHPFADPEYTTFEEKFDAFLVWVSSYHQHPNLAARDPSGLTCARPTENPTPIINRWTAEVGR